MAALSSQDFLQKHQTFPSTAKLTGDDESRYSAAWPSPASSNRRRAARTRRFFFKALDEFPRGQPRPAMRKQTNLQMVSAYRVDDPERDPVIQGARDSVKNARHTDGDLSGNRKRNRHKRRQHRCCRRRQ